MFLAGSALTLSGCAKVGPVAIDQGRTRYNRVIHDTSKQQTLLNLVRISNSESPLFMDVTEVDEATTIQGSVSGGASGLGSIANFVSTSAGTIAGPVGSVTGAGAYQESPTVRYQPLSGQALIAQVSTPLNAESLARFFNSDWSLIAVLQLGIDRLTPGYMDYYPALNAITELDQYGAIVLAATSTVPATEGRAGGFTFSSNPPGEKDGLTIYYQPEAISTAHAKCDARVLHSKAGRQLVDTLWHRLLHIYNLPAQDRLITLRSTGTATQFRV